MKTVREFANEIGVTRQAVYKKINAVGLKGKLTKTDNVLTLSLQQQNTLKNAFNLNLEGDSVNQVDNTVNQSDNSVDSKLVEILTEQLKQKDEQLYQRAEEVKNLQKLLDQQQQLQLNTQQQLEQLQLEYKNEETKEKEVIQEELPKKRKWKFWSK